MTLILLARLTYCWFCGNHILQKAIRAFITTITSIRTLFLLPKVPLLFYTACICSTGVILVFSYLIGNCGEIHIPTFYISLVFFFMLASIIRYLTIYVLEDSSAGAFLSKYARRLYLFSLIPLFYDTNCHRRAMMGILGSYYITKPLLVSTLAIIFATLMAFLIKRSVKLLRFLSLCIFLMYCVVMLSVVYSGDSRAFTGLNNLNSNVLTKMGVIKAIAYANLLATYACDLYCLCMEYAFINYANNVALPYDDRRRLFMITFITVSFLALIWQVVFLNMCNTSILTLENSFVKFCVDKAVGIVFLINSWMQMYLMIEFIDSVKSKLAYLGILSLLIANVFWFPLIAYIAFFMFLLSQFLTSVFVTRAISLID